MSTSPSDATDPLELSPQMRLRELATILATAIRRLKLRSAVDLNHVVREVSHSGDNCLALGVESWPTVQQG